MAENMMFKVEIICPDRMFYEGEVSMLEFTAVDGEIGIYKNHIPTTTVIAPGIARLHEAGGIKRAALHAGFAEITGDKVTILAELAEWPEEIDLNRAQRAKERAEVLLRSHEAAIDTARAQYALRKALTRINVAQK